MNLRGPTNEDSISEGTPLDKAKNADHRASPRSTSERLGDSVQQECTAEDAHEDDPTTEEIRGHGSHEREDRIEKEQEENLARDGGV
jgi:hypothetical protein